MTAVPGATPRVGYGYGLEMTADIDKLQWFASAPEPRAKSAHYRGRLAGQATTCTDDTSYLNRNPGLGRLPGTHLSTSVVQKCERPPYCTTSCAVRLCVRLPEVAVTVRV
jgi:hypothetical protein